MKKRCTNSACRKEFPLLPGRAICPHCGRQYRRVVTPIPVRKADRLKRSPKTPGGFAVVLLDSPCREWKPGTVLPFTKALRCLTGMSLRSAIEAVKRPTILVGELPWEEAEAMTLALEQIGGTVALVSTGNAEKYGVPLSGG